MEVFKFSYICATEMSHDFNMIFKREILIFIRGKIINSSTLYLKKISRKVKDSYRTSEFDIFYKRPSAIDRNYALLSMNVAFNFKLMREYLQISASCAPIEGLKFSLCFKQRALHAQLSLHTNLECYTKTFCNDF